MAHVLERLGGDSLQRLFPNLISSESKITYYPGWKEILIHACAELDTTGMEIYEVACRRGRLELVPCECKHLGLAAKRKIRRIVTKVGTESSRTCVVCGKPRTGRTLRCPSCISP